jgi:membrane protein
LNEFEDGGFMAAKAIKIGKETFKEFNEDRVLRLSAALAYYAIFSIGPLLFILIAIAGFVFGKEAVTGQIAEQLKGMLGDKAAQTVQSMVAAPKLGHNVVTTVLAIVTLLFGASGVFGQLQDALNTIWEVKPKPGVGIMGFLRQRFLSLSMVLGLGFLLLVSMVLTTGVEALAASAKNFLPMPPFVLGALSLILSFAVVTVLFAMIFKFLPDVKVPWREVWIGAASTALLFTAGKFLLSLYLGKQATNSSYGAAGSAIVLLLWIYYSSLILFFGAEFTQVMAKARGVRIVPKKFAVPVEERTREEEGAPHDKGTQATAYATTHSRDKTSTSRKRRKTTEAAIGFPWGVVISGFALWLLGKKKKPSEAK